MHMFDNRITIENRSLLEKYLKSFEYKTSGLSFSSLYMWRDVNRFSWEIIGDYLCFAAISHLPEDQGAAFLFPPLTATGRFNYPSLRETILTAKKRFEERGSEFSIRLIPFHMLECLDMAFKDEMRYIPDRPNYDYVYLRKDLVELAGRAYHAKRNHLNYFLNNYDYVYERLTPEMTDEAMDFIKRFNQVKVVPEEEMELLRMEQAAMEDVFINLDTIGYLGGVIRIDGRIQALSIGGFLGKNAVTVHVEKANVEYRGLYQAINNEFCKGIPTNIKFVNREEDMGIAGLRKAKLSYKPVKLIEKYIAVFN
ncbi:MAG: DUF2156 domain-containing protein [Anaerovoracaceae bacterium]|jgi:hypothetical protein